MKSFFQKIRPFLELLIILLVIFFIAKIFWQNWHALQNFNWHINWLFLILAILFHAGSFSILGLSWKRILSEVTGKNLAVKTVWQIFFTSQVVRYIPGNIWSFINLGVANSEKLGIRKTHTLLAIFIEITLRMAVGALISVIVLFEVFHKYSLFYYAILVLTVLAAFVVLFNQKFLNSLLNWVLRKQGKNFIAKTQFKLKTLFKICGIFALHWLCFGLGFYFVILALNLDISIWKAIGIDILSWIVGFLSIVTPSGIGVREAAIIVLLSRYFNPAIASVISLIARIIYILGELLNLAIVHLWYKKK